MHEHALPEASTEHMRICMEPIRMFIEMLYNSQARILSKGPFSAREFEQLKFIFFFFFRFGVMDIQPLNLTDSTAGLAAGGVYNCSFRQASAPFHFIKPVRKEIKPVNTIKCNSCNREVLKRIGTNVLIIKGL